MTEGPLTDFDRMVLFLTAPKRTTQEIHIAARIECNRPDMRESAIALTLRHLRRLGLVHFTTGQKVWMLTALGKEALQ